MRRHTAVRSYSQYAAILGSRNFWAVGLVLAAISGINQAVVVTLVPYAQELGFSPASAAFLISAFSVTAAIVKLASGYLADYVERRAIMIAATLCMGASLFLLLSFSNYPMLMLASCLAGAALGCSLPASAALVAACFGSRSFGRVMGLIYAGVVVSSLVTVRFIGAVFDSTGAYHSAFLAFLVIAAGSALAAVLIRAPAGEAELQAADLSLAASKNIVGNGSPR
jgi:MFS family permease